MKIDRAVQITYFLPRERVYRALLAEFITKQPGKAIRMCVQGRSAR